MHHQPRAAHRSRCAPIEHSSRSLASNSTAQASGTVRRGHSAYQGAGETNHENKQFQELIYAASVCVTMGCITIPFVLPYSWGQCSPCWPSSSKTAQGMGAKPKTRPGRKTMNILHADKGNHIQTSAPPGSTAGGAKCARATLNRIPPWLKQTTSSRER